MNKGSKIVSIILKLLIGSGSLLIVYYRLKNDLTPSRFELMAGSIAQNKGLLLLVLCLLLMPLNWGLESFKWKLITAPVEKVSYQLASRSVYSGVCLGNFAPGRATEFIAKILFFKEDNRSKITVLHFVNGMFQFSITVIIGFIAVLLRVKELGTEYNWVIYASAAVGLFMLGLLAWCIANINMLLHWVVKKISSKKSLEPFTYHFPTKTLFSLFGFSLLRYGIFFTQFALLLLVFMPGGLNPSLLSGISVYFLITASIPMFSAVEAAIRAAVALLVFKGAGSSDAVIAIATIALWFINIVIPSLIGYYFLLRRNFNFKFIKTKN